MAITVPSPWAVAADVFDPPGDLYKTDPAGWISDKTSGYLWSKQREIAETVARSRYTAVRSCHGVGKSWLAARIAAWWIDSHPVGSAFVVTSAPTAAQVSAVLWRELRVAHRQAGLAGYLTQGQVPEWKVGGELVAFGRKPSDTDPAAFQGIHARFVLVILDEACGIPKALWDAVDSLVTNDESKAFAVGNPDDPASHFAKVCQPGSGWDVIGIDAFDSPNLTGEPIPEALKPMLVGETWVQERRARWGEGSPLWAAKVRGEFPDVSDDTLIQPSWVRHAHEQTLPGLEHGQFGVDIARYGTDESIVARDRGGQVRVVDRWAKLDTMATAGRVAKHLQDTGKGIPAVMDIVGVGAGPYDRLREQSLPVVAFNAAERAYEPERFANRRAETYWTLREDMEAGRVDLDPADDVLASQLQSMRWKVDSRGRILIESKDEMRRRGLPSPDRADAVVMCRFRRPEVLPAGEQPKTVGEVDFLTVKW